MTGYIASLKAEIEALAVRTSAIDAVITAGSVHAELQRQLAALKAKEYEKRVRIERKEVQYLGIDEKKADNLRYEMSLLEGTRDKYETVTEWVTREFDNSYPVETQVYVGTETYIKNERKYNQLKQELDRTLFFQVPLIAIRDVEIPYEVHHPEITQQITAFIPQVQSALAQYQQAWRGYLTRFGRAQGSDEPGKEKQALQSREAQASFEVTVCEALGFDRAPKEALSHNHPRVRVPFEHWIDNTATAGDLQTLCIAAKVKGHRLEPLSDMLEDDLQQQKRSGHGGLLHQARGVYKWLTLRGQEAQDLERA